MNSNIDYNGLRDSAVSLVTDVPHLTADLANVSALLFTTLPTLNWAGFYLSEGDKLVLGPFQGKPACIEIPYGRGVCGTAAKEDRTVVVADVHKFPGHIACDGASLSEIVIPLHKDGKVFGVIDIDSPVTDRFSDVDRAGLESVVKALESVLPL
jgi:GAF domain-containing protein